MARGNYDSASKKGIDDDAITIVGMAIALRHRGSEPVFRERIFLAGISGAFISKEVHIYRLYCDAV